MLLYDIRLVMNLRKYDLKLIIIHKKKYMFIKVSNIHIPIQLDDINMVVTYIVFYIV